MTRPTCTGFNLLGTVTLSPVSNEKESKRWNDELWVAAWPKRERLTEALTPYLLEAASAQPGQRVCDIDVYKRQNEVKLTPICTDHRIHQNHHCTTVVPRRAG